MSEYYRPDYFQDTKAPQLEGMTDDDYSFYDKIDKNLGWKEPKIKESEVIYEPRH